MGVLVVMARFNALGVFTAVARFVLLVVLHAIARFTTLGVLVFLARLPTLGDFTNLAHHTPNNRPPVPPCQPVPVSRAGRPAFGGLYLGHG